ncbi:uncharacterized protein [Diabrotica undecimpunctata]|uniref:uncharacterized protein n=1 Tax=Diabrotica undecimpunctata TaxID=50387 RepID=UPI003B63AB1B
MCGVKIDFNGRVINIISLYKPDKNISIREWKRLFNWCSSLEGETVLGGDFNAHHAVWGSPKNDTDGNRIIDAITDMDLIFLNDCSATRITHPNSTKSAVDLTLITPGLIALAHWQTLDRTLGSDHYIISIKLNIDVPSCIVYPTRKWKLEKANWELFHSTLEMKLKNVVYSENCNKMAFNLNRAINTNSEASIPQNVPFSPKHGKKSIWWDDECNTQIQLKKNALKKYKTASTLNTFLEYKKIEATTKKMFKHKSKTTWIKFCSSLNSSCPSTQIWKMANKLNNKNANIKHAPSAVAEDILQKLCPPFVDKHIPYMASQPEEHYLLKK